MNQNKPLRFEFGRNWKNYLTVLDDERTNQATIALTDLLTVSDIHGKSFLDIGSGSGLYSLAAKKLGAFVTSFDYDRDSVECTNKLKEKFFPQDKHWSNEQGSVLDSNYMSNLGKFDIVYSWGVLHHTGDMWQALENVKHLVSPEGLLAIAIYNDQGSVSKIWKWVKKTYCNGIIGRYLMTAACVPYFVISHLVKDIVRLRNPLRRYIEYRKNRGMSVVHDWLDWIGGYPFEVAKPEEIIEFYQAAGFRLIKLKTTNHLGNNQFCFKLSTNNHPN